MYTHIKVKEEEVFTYKKKKIQTFKILSFCELPSITKNEKKCISKYNIYFISKTCIQLFMNLKHACASYGL